MGKYEVKIKESEIYIVEVEADNEFKAKEIALDIIDQEGARATYHDDSDGEIEAFEIDD